MTILVEIEIEPKETGDQQALDDAMEVIAQNIKGAANSISGVIVQGITTTRLEGTMDDLVPDERWGEVCGETVQEHRRLARGLRKLAQLEKQGDESNDEGTLDQ